MGSEDIILKRKKQITNTIERSKIISTSKIAHLTGLHPYVVKDVLQSLKEEKVIENKITIRGQFWRIRKGGKIK